MQRTTSKALPPMRKGFCHTVYRKKSIASELVLQDDVVRTALDDARRGYERDLRFVAQLTEVERTAVAHRRADLAQRDVDVVAQGTGIGNVGVDALFKRQLAVAAEVVALPVARAVRAFAPIFLVVGAVDLDLVRRALVEAREVAAEHHEVRAHRQGDLLLSTDFRQK